MRYFAAIVHKDDGSSFGLTFPDLPGCFSASETWDEIPATATDALDLWFADGADIDPAHLHDVCARPDILAQINNGAALIGIGYAKTEPTK